MERSKGLATVLAPPSACCKTLSQKLGDLFGLMLLNVLVPRNHLGRFVADPYLGPAGGLESGPRSNRSSLVAQRLPTVPARDWVLRSDYVRLGDWPRPVCSRQLCNASPTIGPAPGYISFHPVASPWMPFRLARRWRIREIFLVLLQDSPNVVWDCKRHLVVCAHLTRLGGDDYDPSR